jgi:hypothetical protein
MNEHWEAIGGDQGNIIRRSYFNDGYRAAVNDAKRLEIPKTSIDSVYLLPDMTTQTKANFSHDVYMENKTGKPLTVRVLEVDDKVVNLIIENT